MVTPLESIGDGTQASRERPPKVAAKLATNAPASSATNSHNAP